MPKLVLFDIDETMISSDGCGRRALERAMTETLGSAISSEGHSLSGKTDPQIIHEVLAAHEYDEPEIAELLPRIFQRYLPALQDEVRTAKSLRMHPGINQLLRALEAKPEAFLGLLTGNIEPGARIKLEPFSLNSFFSFGAFGSDSRNRMDLPAVASARARQRFGQAFAPEQIVIIGDARNDVLCAKGFGACALAVATGRTPKSELAELEPDFLFDDLSNTESVLAAIFAN